MTTYADVIAGISGRIAHWRLGDTTGTTITDEAGLSDGTYSNATLAATAGPHISGPDAVYFPKTAHGDCFTAALASAFNTSTYTVGLWFKVNTANWTDSTEENFLRLDTDDEANGIVVLSKSPTNNTVFAAQIDNGFNAYIINGLVDSGELDEWHHLAFVQNVGTIQAFLDGSSIGSTTGRLALSGTLDRFTLGSNDESGSGTYDGDCYLADVVLFDRALSSSEITTISTAVDETPVDPGVPYQAGCISGTIDDLPARFCDARETIIDELEENNKCCVAHLASSVIVDDFTATGWPDGTPERCPELWVILDTGDEYISIDSGVTWRQIFSSAVSESGFTGEIRMWVDPTAPTGWLNCDGSAVSRTTYADLFAIIGVTFGPGDGSTTFNLPDLRGRTILGYNGVTYAIGGTGGEEAHTLTEGEMAAHDHYDNRLYRTTGADRTWVTGTAQTPAHTSTGGDVPHNNMNPFLAIDFIIKV